MIVAFLGPSLLRDEVPRGFDVRPPARQGDVWRALADRPRAIALIDGVFESVPSVWHHELLDALDAGVPVFGGASMGALRAAELHRRGMVGVGTIFRWYRDGVLDDDAAVALLHAGPEHEFRPFTVPHVNVLHAAEIARRQRVLRPREARAIAEASASIFFQERTWPRILAAAHLPAPASERWERFAAAGLPDLKADDARLVLRAALAATPLPVAPRDPRESSAVRMRRIQSLDAPDALADDGLRRLLLAAFARQAGLRATEGEIATEERKWMGRAGVRSPEALLRATGMDPAELGRACEDLALERLVLDSASRFVNDGPTRAEAALFEARVRAETNRAKFRRTQARRRR